MSDIGFNQFYHYSQTFTAAGDGAIHDLRINPCQTFSVQVGATGGTPTLWNVVLEGSLDGTNFSTILSHTSANLGLNSIIGTGNQVFPCTYIRIKVVTLTLGIATSITVNIAGLD